MLAHPLPVVALSSRWSSWSVDLQFFWFLCQACSCCYSWKSNFSSWIVHHCISYLPTFRLQKMGGILDGGRVLCFSILNNVTHSCFTLPLEESVICIPPTIPILREIRAAEFAVMHERKTTAFSSLFEFLLVGWCLQHLVRARDMPRASV